MDPGGPPDPPPIAGAASGAAVGPWQTSHQTYFSVFINGRSTDWFLQLWRDERARAARARTRTHDHPFVLPPALPPPVLVARDRGRCV